MEDKQSKMSAEFEVHLLNNEGIAKARTVALCFDGFLDRLQELCPPSREFSIVRAKLEEANFYAQKAMAWNDAYRKNVLPDE